MSPPQDRRKELALRSAVDRLLEEGLLEFVESPSGRRAVATEQAAGEADLNRVRVVIRAMAPPSPK